jgi:acyl-CoA synthetase (AMP-forming)/AMP-acid ligase II
MHRPQIRTSNALTPHDLPRTATGKVQRNKLREQLRRDPH